VRRSQLKGHRFQAGEVQEFFEAAELIRRNHWTVSYTLQIEATGISEVF